MAVKDAIMPFTATIKNYKEDFYQCIMHNAQCTMHNGCQRQLSLIVLKKDPASISFGTRARSLPPW